MIHYLEFATPCAADALPRVGGRASLPAELAWPADQDGVPMLHLLSLPARFVNAHAGSAIAADHCLSVFMPYRSDSIDHVIALARNPAAARVIVHPIAPALRNECLHPLEPAHALLVDTDMDADEEDEFSDEIDNKVGGQATWLQERIEAPGKTFVLQLLGALFDRYWPSHRGLFMGGVVYLFLDEAPKENGQPCGQLTVQYS